MLEQKDIFIILQCAPVIVGVKSSNTVMVSKEKKKWIQEIIENSSLHCICLYKKKENYYIFLYNKEKLDNYLKKTEVKDFLKKFGYKNFKLKSLLSKLLKKFLQYEKGIIAFPHELGIFLEYPIKDIESFLKEEGKNSLFTGYWKVYQNPAYAIETFEKYNQAKLCIVNDFLQNKNLEEIISQYCKKKEN